MCGAGGAGAVRATGAAGHGEDQCHHPQVSPSTTFSIQRAYATLDDVLFLLPGHQRAHTFVKAHRSCPLTVALPGAATMPTLVLLKAAQVRPQRKGARVAREQAGGPGSVQCAHGGGVWRLHGRWRPLLTSRLGGFRTCPGWILIPHFHTHCRGLARAALALLASCRQPGDTRLRSAATLAAAAQTPRCALCLCVPDKSSAPPNSRASLDAGGSHSCGRHKGACDIPRNQVNYGCSRINMAAAVSMTWLLRSTGMVVTSALEAQSLQIHAYHGTPDRSACAFLNVQLYDLLRLDPSSSSKLECFIGRANTSVSGGNVPRAWVTNQIATLNKYYATVRILPRSVSLLWERRLMHGRFHTLPYGTDVGLAHLMAILSAGQVQVRSEQADTDDQQGLVQDAARDEHRAGGKYVLSAWVYPRASSGGAFSSAIDATSTINCHAHRARPTQVPLRRQSML